jgi:hypothetical protein
MTRHVIALILAAAGSALAQPVIVSDHDEYIAYADAASRSREGALVWMSDIVDLKSARASPLGNLHSSSRAHSQFDCDAPRMRPVAFSLYAGTMGGGELVESVALSGGWLPVAPGTLLDRLWQFACGRT